MPAQKQNKVKGRDKTKLNKPKKQANGRLAYACVREDGIGVVRENKKEK